MSEVTIKIKRVRGDRDADIPLPAYMSDSASGADLHAAVDEDLVLHPGQRALVPTGLSVSIPRGCEIQIRPRSGLAIRHGITLLNTPGTIDSDYRGEIRIIAINLSDEPFTIRRGDRIAQMVVGRTWQAQFELAADLDPTGRSSGGFGSTGV